MRARGGVMSKLINAIKKNREKVLRELFANESDCYIDDKEVLQGMSVDRFVEVVEAILILNFEAKK
jgi:hypothetical protein